MRGEEENKKRKKSGCIRGKTVGLMVWESNKAAVEFYKFLEMTEQRYSLEKKL